MPTEKEKIKPFIDYLSHRMIMEKPNSDALKDVVEKRLLLFKIPEVRRSLLSRIYKLKETLRIDIFYKNDIQDFFNDLELKIMDEQDDSEEIDIQVIQESDSMIMTENKQLLSIHTNAGCDEILSFWLKLRGNNKKGKPYWESKDEIEHFVNQNFEGFDGVGSIQEFNPNMNKSELYHVTWKFYRIYKVSNSKIQYVDLLVKNFIRFRGAEHVYGNIKDQIKPHLNKLLS
jgi:hypothetical protein